MDEFVRIKAANGSRVTVGRVYAETLEGVEYVDEPATNAWGQPLPATRENGRPKKPRTTVKKAAAAKKAAAGNTTEKSGVAATPEEASA